MTGVSTRDVCGRQVEVQSSPSQKFPGRTNFAVYGVWPEDVQRVIQDLGDEFAFIQFTVPSRCEVNRWGALGQGWNAL